jgi:hypothetical protein
MVTLELISGDGGDNWWLCCTADDPHHDYWWRILWPWKTPYLDASDANYMRPGFSLMLTKKLELRLTCWWTV